MTQCMRPDFCECHERTARKQHRCCECSAPIMPGDKYISVAGKWEGDFSTYKHHWLCAEACEYIRDHFNDNDCIGFSTLKEWYGEWRMGWQGRCRDDADVVAFRSLMAKILWRERRARR